MLFMLSSTKMGSTFPGRVTMSVSPNSAVYGGIRQLRLRPCELGVPSFDLEGIENIIERDIR